jgi:Protein of unknown function (DUF541)
MTNTVTSVSARGFVVADFDTATFTLSFNEFAPKSRDAKLKLKKGVEKITSTIEALKKKGLVVLVTHFKSNITVGPNQVYSHSTGKHKIEGQKATYVVTFQTPSLEMVSETYDALSELDVNELTVNSPLFSLRAEAALKQQALEDAWKVAQVLFTNQCEVLGLVPSNYSVSSWKVNYSGYDHGGFAKGRNLSNSTAVLGGSGSGYDGDDAIELNSGRAVVDVILTVDYVKTSS